MQKPKPYEGPLLSSRNTSTTQTRDIQDFFDPKLTATATNCKTICRHYLPKSQLQHFQLGPIAQTVPAAWKKWDKIMLWMNTTPTGTTLTNPLGPWLLSYQEDYEWAWHIHIPMHDNSVSPPQACLVWIHQSMTCLNNLIFHIECRPKKLYSTPYHTNYSPSQTIHHHHCAPNC